jgi:hypothetical protein
MPDNDYAVVRHRLDLLVRLIDTTTGGAVSEKDTAFYFSGRRTFPLTKEQGVYVFCGTGRMDFELTVNVFGFEDKKLAVVYENLDGALPELELHMIPNKHSKSVQPYLTLEGYRPGLVSVDAVKNGDSPCFIRDFDARKRVMTVFNPHGLEMNRVHYAVVNQADATYEVVDIQARVSEQSFKLDRKLAKAFDSHFPVCRLVFGTVYPDGRYILRVLKNSADTRWIVRLTTDSGEEFRAVDFNRPETLGLDAS